MSNFIINDNNSIKTAYVITKIMINDKYYLIYAIKKEDKYTIYSSCINTTNNKEYLTQSDNKEIIKDFIESISKEDINDNLVINTKKRLNIKIKSNKINIGLNEKLNNEDSIYYIDTITFDKLFYYFIELNKKMELLKVVEDKKKGFITLYSLLIYLGVIFTIIEYFIILFIRC